MVASVATTVDPRTRHRAQPSVSQGIRYEPIGAARELFFALDPEVLIEGPAGTGKSLGSLHKLNRNAIKYPGSRQLIVRKTRTSLTQTALVSFEKHVIVAGGRIRFHTTMQAYIYPNGSIVVVAGLDKDSKVMSSEYDGIYVQEATELEESEWEALTTRLRNGVIPHQQIWGDCNPGPPTHWINQRCLKGSMRRIISRHEDNPTLWDAVAKTWTKPGAEYIAKLDALTGVRKERLRFGRWAAAEGLIFEGWDTAVHLIDDYQGMSRTEVAQCGWTHFWDIDFGFTNPFVWHDVVMDPDGRLIVVDEIYKTQVLVEDHAANILRRTADRPRPKAIITDHDAEDRATFERKTGMKTTAAVKEVSPGLQAVSSRLRPSGDLKPRFYLFRDACPVHERDRSLSERGKPSCTAEEFPTYVWDTRQGVKKGEAPLKEDDHGMDAVRYQVAYHDLRSKGRMWSFSS